MRTSYYFSVLLVIMATAASLLSGCKGQRRLVQETAPDEVKGCLSNRYLQANNCFFAFESSSQNFSASGEIYLDRDSLSYFRASFLIELARALVTSESAQVLNRLERKHIIFSPERMEGITQFPVSPNLIHHLVSASPCLEQYFASVTVRTRTMDDHKSLILRDGAEVQLFHSSGQLNRIVYITPVANTYASISYDSMVQTVNGSLLPSKILVESFRSGKKTISVLLEIGQWMEGIKKPVNFVVPSGYTTVKP